MRFSGARGAVWSAFCLLGLAGSVTFADDAFALPAKKGAQIAPPTAKKAVVVAPAKKPAKPTPVGNRGGKAARKPGSARGEANLAARESISGTSAKTPGPELQALHDVDDLLFADAKKNASTSLMVEPKEVASSTSGLPPASEPSGTPATDPAQQSDLSWLAKLRRPDIPFRWDPRLIRYLDYFKNSPNGRAMVAGLLKRSGRYVDAVQKELRARNLPEDIVWLSLIESGMDPHISSGAGAAGLWQFMPKAGAAYGLHIDRWVDERLDPERSTAAALDYLTDLHSRFGRWELAFAAYNMGHGGLLTSIRKYNTNDYWQLSDFEAGVPYETALYVPKIIAIAFVAHNRQVFGADKIDLDAAEPFVPTEKAAAVVDPKETKPKEAPKPKELNHSAKALAFAKPVTVAPTPAKPLEKPKPAKAEPLRTDEEANKPHLPPIGDFDEISLRWGESLEDLAAAHGTTESKLRAINGFASPVPPRPGTKVYVPRGSGKGDLPAMVAVVPPGPQSLGERKRVFYQVVWGDELDDVARKLGVRSSDLCQWNNLDETARLHAKMVLQAFVPKAQKLEDVRVTPSTEAHVVTVGSDDFFTYFEGQNGRKRVVQTVGKGDTWMTIAHKAGSSVAALERINQRSHYSKLSPGEHVVVYTHGAGTPTLPSPVAAHEESPYDDSGDKLAAPASIED